MSVSIGRTNPNYRSRLIAIGMTKLYSVSEYSKTTISMPLYMSAYHVPSMKELNLDDQTRDAINEGLSRAQQDNAEKKQK